MTKKLLLFLSLLLWLSPAFSQAGNQLEKKALVRVQVDGANGDRGICTGFLWKDAQYIITALHAMKPNGKILVFYTGGAQRYAEVVRVYKQADLVMLKTTSPPPVSGDIAAISSFQERVTDGEKLTAYGYYGGAPSRTNQSLDKGSTDPDPETIQGIAPLTLQSMVKSIQFPSITFNIYYLTGGSLLPGYSGCPVFNKNKELIGIGDGGLDKGQTNVSWCIPAANITKLEQSQEQLPNNLGATTIHFTTDVSIPLSENTTAGNNNGGNNNNGNAAGEDDVQKYEFFASGDFDFYLTKTRSWNEMKSTAIDPGNMDGFVQDLAQNKLNVDCSQMNFDIYEDLNYGFVIVVPEMAKLNLIDKETNTFGVQLSDLDMEDDANNYFQLYYFTSGVDGDPATQLINIVTNSLKEDNPKVTANIIPEYTKRYQISDEWTADYRCFAGSEAVKDPKLGEVIAFFYLSTIYNHDIAFNSIAAALIPTNRQDLLDALLTKGVDCIGNYGNNTTVCDFYETFVKIIAAAHLTSISY